MNFFIPVFQSREPAFAPYRTPAIDVLADGGPLVFAPPPTPRIVSATYGILRFTPVERATGYKLYRLSSTGYQEVPSHWVGSSVYSFYLEAVSFFTITAVNAAGESPASSAVLLTTPEIPMTVDSTNITVDSTAITVDEA